MTPTGTLHFIASLVALLSGAIVLRLPKGTRWHRTLGHAYAWSMIVVVITSFALFTLTGRVGPFHGAAVVAGVTLAGGLATVLWRRPRRGWIEAHATWMAWSYIGLVAAAVAETSTRFLMPYLAARGTLEGHFGAFWTIVGVASGSVFLIGARLVRRRLPASVASAPASIRREREALRQVEAAPAGD